MVVLWYLWDPIVVVDGSFCGGILGFLWSDFTHLQVLMWSSCGIHVVVYWSVVGFMWSSSGRLLLVFAGLLVVFWSFCGIPVVVL